MFIAVFNFTNDSLDIIQADKVYIDDIYASDVENYLVQEHNYNPDDMCFMSGMTQINFISNDELNQIK